MNDALVYTINNKVRIMPIIQQIWCIFLISPIWKFNKQNWFPTVSKLTSSTNVLKVLLCRVFGEAKFCWNTVNIYTTVDLKKIVWQLLVKITILVSSVKASTDLFFWNFHTVTVTRFYHKKRFKGTVSEIMQKALNFVEK